MAAGVRQSLIKGSDEENNEIAIGMNLWWAPGDEISLGREHKTTCDTRAC
jgi:hypothetical protein